MTETPSPELLTGRTIRPYAWARSIGYLRAVMRKQSMTETPSPELLTGRTIPPYAWAWSIGYLRAVLRK